MRCVDFDRIGRIGKYYHVKPSSYFNNLDAGEALLFDEACIVIMEENNKLYLEKQKQKQKEEEKARRFHEDASSMFEVDSREF